MERAVSTVLDVALCLLLVGAAVTTLTVAVPDVETETPDADDPAETLQTATVAVPAGDERSAHDTYAGHLATAALADAGVDDGHPEQFAYPSAVRNETAAVVDRRTAVSAAWEPYPGAPLAGNVAVGERPPAGADVSTTRVTVDSGLEVDDSGSFERLAESIAEAYVEWCFPPARTRAALVDARRAAEAAARYRVVAGALDVSVEEPVAETAVHRANERLAAELAERIEADLRGRYGTVEAAAADLTVDEVAIVVNRWSA